MELGKRQWLYEMGVSRYYLESETPSSLEVLRTEVRFDGHNAVGRLTAGKLTAKTDVIEASWNKKQPRD